jgi:hypothetical protein
VLQAVGTAVFGRISGPLHPGVAVTSVVVNVSRSLASQFGGSVDATVKYSVANTGNQNVTPKVKVTLNPLIGTGTSRSVQLPQILPGSTVTFRENFRNVTPFGYLSATVTATAHGMQSTGSSAAIVVPWGLVLVLVLIIGSVWFVVRRRRRSQMEP